MDLYNKRPNNDMQTDVGAKLGFWGAAISTLGDAISTLGAAIAIEEARAADLVQQQQMEKLQNQIDDLKKGQTDTDDMKNGQIDIDALNKLLGKLVDRLE